MFQIDAAARIPIYEQIINQTEKMILNGILKAQNKLPSVRKLSIELSVNPNTIQRAYNDMCAKGILYSVMGKGCFVSNDAKEVLLKFSYIKLNELLAMLKEVKSLGIPKGTIIEYVEKIYGEQGENI